MTVSSVLNWPAERPSFLVGRVPFKRSAANSEVPSECWVCFTQISWGHEVLHARGAHPERAVTEGENWNFAGEEWERLAAELAAQLDGP